MLFEGIPDQIIPSNQMAPTTVNSTNQPRMNLPRCRHVRPIRCLCWFSIAGVLIQSCQNFAAFCLFIGRFALRGYTLWYVLDVVFIQELSVFFHHHSRYTNRSDIQHIRDERYVWLIVWFLFGSSGLIGQLNYHFVWDFGEKIIIEIICVYRYGEGFLHRAKIDRFVFVKIWSN